MSEAVPAKTAPVPAKTDEPRKLDDVLLAMDVVDTLRHRERIVDLELSAEAREEQLVARLKEIYGAQGIEVPDRILKDGVKALEEHRFVYKPPEPSFNVKLAKLYVSRKRWLPGTLSLVGGIAALLVGWQVFWAMPQAAEMQRLPAEIARLSNEAQALAVDAQVDGEIAAIARAGQSAVAGGDHGDARASLAALRTMKDQLGAEYDVRIVSRPGEDSGFFRIPDDVPNGRNYYIVVEAVAPGGRVIEVPIADEQTQKTATIHKWAQRVDKAVYDKVAEDKRGDQIVQNDILGRKAVGELNPVYDPGVETGAITRW